MERRRLGETDLEASVIGFGCNRIAAHPRQRAEVIATLELALDRGIDLFDTASSYDGGESERLLGEVFRGRRRELVLCSKAGHSFWAALPFEISRPPRIARRLLRSEAVQKLAAPLRVRGSQRNFRSRWLSRAVELSLRRLDTDYLDLFYLHNPPPEIVADDAVFETLEALRDRGLIRYFGISCATDARSDEALACLRHPGVSALQVLVNPLESIDLEQIAPRARERGVGIVARQPFHKGAIFWDPRLRETLARNPQRSPAQTALRLALQLPGVERVLVGMTQRHHLEENLAALETPPLAPDEVAEFYAAALKR